MSVPKDFLCHLPAYKEKTDPEVLKRRQQVVMHPNVEQDYSVRRQNGGSAAIQQDVCSYGHDVALSSVRQDVNHFRSSYRYLTDPDARDFFNEKVKEGEYRPDLTAIRALQDHHLKTWADLERFFEEEEPEPEEEEPEEEEPEEVKVPSNGKGTPAPVGDFVERIRHVGEALSVGWQEAMARITVLEARVARLEQTKRSLNGENVALEELVTELEDQLAEAQAAAAGKPSEAESKIVLPEEHEGKPFRYQKTFVREFDRRQPHQKVQVIRFLERRHTKTLPLNPSTKLDGVPSDSFISRAGDYRVVWKEKRDHIKVYDLLHRGDSRLGYTEG